MQILRHARIHLAQAGVVLDCLQPHIHLAIVLLQHGQHLRILLRAAAVVRQRCHDALRLVRRNLRAFVVCQPPHCRARRIQHVRDAQLQQALARVFVAHRVQVLPIQQRF